MLLQEYARTKDQLTHFLTYADNNAVGYFAKQGFTTEITMPREQVSQAVQPVPVQEHCTTSTCAMLAAIRLGIMVPVAMCIRDHGRSWSWLNSFFPCKHNARPGPCQTCYHVS